MESAEKKCPFCAELIKIEAVKCKHCGSSITPDYSLTPKPTKKDVVIFLALISIPFILGGVMVLWLEHLPPAEKERLERQFH